MFKPTSSDPNLITISAAVYRLLLVFYPTRFRREYGPHMTQVFHDCCLKAYRQSGLPGMFALWTFTLFDWFKTVIEEQLNKDTGMTHAKFIRLSGWGMALAGFAHILGLLASNSQSFLYRTFKVGYATSEMFSGILLMSFTFLLVIGMLGLFLHYQDQARGSEAFPLIGGIILGLLNMLAGLPLFSVASDAVWTIWYYSFVLMLLSLGFFGILALRMATLKRWGVLALLAGVPYPAATLVLVILEQFSGAWQVPVGIFIGLAAVFITAIALVFLGYSMQTVTSVEKVAI